MSSTEDKAYEIMRELDVNYVLVIFGGLTGYASDGNGISAHVCMYKLHFFTDINKFLWMVRIGGSTEKGQHIKEADYFTPQGEFRVDREGSSTLLNCLMYKLCYYRFGEVYTEQGELGACKIHNIKFIGPAYTAHKFQRLPLIFCFWNKPPNCFILEFQKLLQCMEALMQAVVCCRKA